MTDRIAFFTLDVLKAPVGDAAVRGLVDRLGDVYAAAEGSVGFFDRSARNVETGARPSIASGALARMKRPEHR